MFPLHSQKGPYTLNQIEMSQSRPLARPSVPARGRTSLLGPTGRMDPSPRGKAGGREREKKRAHCTNITTKGELPSHQRSDVEDKLTKRV